MNYEIRVESLTAILKKDEREKLIKNITDEYWRKRKRRTSKTEIILTVNNKHEKLERRRNIKH